MRFNFENVVRFNCVCVCVIRVSLWPKRNWTRVNMNCRFNILNNWFYIHCYRFFAKACKCHCELLFASNKMKTHWNMKVAFIMILPICEVYLLTKRIFSNEIQLILLLQLFIRSWLGSKRWIYLSDRISYVLDVYNYILSCEHDRYIIPSIYVFSMVRFIHQFHSINSYCFSRSAVAYWYCLEISKIKFNGNSSFSERYSITIYIY